MRDLRRSVRLLTPYLLLEYSEHTCVKCLNTLRARVMDVRMKKTSIELAEESSKRID